MLSAWNGVFFFLQAEAGIRDLTVTGVQTCALPICERARGRVQVAIDPTLLHRDVDRATWTLPLAFSRRDPRVLYFSRERLFRTEAEGRHWTVISPDLTREDPGVPPTLDAATAADKPRPGRRHGVIYAIAPSRRADRDL